MNSLNLLAYIDPMSGAIVLQLLVAFVAGTAAYFRHTVFGGIKRLFFKSNDELENQKAS